MDTSVAGAKVDSKGASKAPWQHDLYELLRRHGITQFCYVPDAGHAVLIDRSLADPDVHSIALTTEEEGVDAEDQAGERRSPGRALPIAVMEPAESCTFAC